MTDFYRYTLPGHGIVFEADRLRRERDELHGELTVRADIPNAIDGILNVGTLNLSSPRARQERAKLLAQRANLNGTIDWILAVETLCQGAMKAEREGQPAVDLRQIPRPTREEEIRVEGLTFPRRHPSIVFGDGGAAKSYTGLFVAGRLALSGLKVAV